MHQRLTSQIAASMEKKTTEELSAMVSNQNTEEWSAQALEAARAVLEERGVDSPTVSTQIDTSNSNQSSRGLIGLGVFFATAVLWYLLLRLCLFALVGPVPGGGLVQLVRLPFAFVGFVLDELGVGPVGAIAVAVLLAAGTALFVLDSIVTDDERNSPRNPW